MLEEHPLPPLSEDRIQLVAELIGPGPEPVALATAGLKDQARLSVIKSNYAPLLPDLVPRLRAATGRRVAPLQDDGWSAAVAERAFGVLGPRGYYLGSGTGLAEAVTQNGSLVEDLTKAYQLGREEALRADNWRHRADSEVVGLLKELVDWRRETFNLEQVVLALRFRHRPQLVAALARVSGLQVDLSEFIAAPAVGAVLLSENLEGAGRSFEKPPA